MEGKGKKGGYVEFEFIRNLEADYHATNYVSLEKCIGCGACATFALYGLRDEERGEREKGGGAVYQEDCFLCQACQAKCPTDAITIEW